MPIRKILVANRGEIAIRILRACQETDLLSVAIFSLSDSDSLHRSFANESYLLSEVVDGPAAYLNIDAIIQIAKRSNSDAIHPGYGFLSESAEFAKACGDAGIKFIGPCHTAIKSLGDKVEAKSIAGKLKIPILPFTIAQENLTAEQENYIRTEIGFPVLLKAAMGGGGRGIRLVQHETELSESFARCSSEAKKFFGDGRVFVEKYITNAKHIEVQIIGDGIHVTHLYDRDCTVQRRQQKVVEFGPSLQQNQGMYQDALAIATSVGYTSAGTVEFVVDLETGKYYFMEMNPRLQVEHTVTELVTGVDIVKSQILIAQGETLQSLGLVDSKGKSLVTVKGFAIQCRILAENPESGFTPTTGVIEEYVPPTGPGVRVDSSVKIGLRITPQYDPLLLKVICWDETFLSCVRRSLGALKELQVYGVKTNTKFLMQLLSYKPFLDQHLSTTTLESKIKEIASVQHGVALPSFHQDFNHQTIFPGDQFALTSGEGNSHRLSIRDLKKDQTGGENTISIDFDGNFRSFTFTRTNDAKAQSSRLVGKIREKYSKVNMGHIGAPYDGAVVEVLKPVGTRVKKGDGLIVVSAMKMETVLSSSIDGLVSRICVSAGDVITQNDLLVEVSAASKL